MRWSQMHIPTLREDPADAGAPSHRLLLRAGYIRQLMAGHYSLLPLGVRVRAKVMAIIRDAELAGIPFRVTAGKRGLAGGAAELTDRATGDTQKVPLDEIAETVRKAVTAGPLTR